MEKRARLESKAKTYRISTQISDDYGNRLEKLRFIVRQQTGKKPKIGELIEMCIECMEDNYEPKKQKDVLLF